MKYGVLFYIECSYNANANDQNPSVIICPLTVTMISFAKPQVQPCLARLCTPLGTTH